MSNRIAITVSNELDEMHDVTIKDDYAHGVYVLMEKPPESDVALFQQLLAESEKPEFQPMFPEIYDIFQHMKQHEKGAFIRGTWHDYEELMAEPPKIIKLPIHNITITLQKPGETNGGDVTSSLSNPYDDDTCHYCGGTCPSHPEENVCDGFAGDIDFKYPDIDLTDTLPNHSNHFYFEGGKEVLYAMLLAHAAAGIDVTTPEYLKGVQAAVDALLLL